MVVEEESVRYEVRVPAAHLTIDRPAKRNALSYDVIERLIGWLRRAAEDPDVRCVVLTGAGDKAFSAGGDLSGDSPVAGGAEGAAEAHRRRGRLGELLVSIVRHPKPVIARVGGGALAGGFGLVLACDLVVAAEDVELGTPEVNIGLWPFMISALLKRNLPRKVCLEMMLTGKRLTAAEGARWGIVNRLVPRDGLDRAVDELVGELASKSPLVLRLGKESFHRSEDMSFDEAMAYLQGMLSVNLQSEDLAEGIDAFIEKRSPRWTGR